MLLFNTYLAESILQTLTHFKRFANICAVSECGGDLNAPVGTFTSPNYPSPYPHNRVCEWRITVQEGRRVTLTIDDMRVEDQLRCRSDYMAVSVRKKY